MGYYSEVALIIKRTDAIKLFNKAIDRTNTVQGSYCLPLLIEGYGKDPNWNTSTPERLAGWVKQTKDIIKELKSKTTDKTVFHWDYTKWYYDDVDKFITPFYTKLKYYEFMRLGEENSDIEEEENNGAYLLHMVRSIDIEISND